MVYVYAVARSTCPVLGVVCHEAEVPAEVERMHARILEDEVLACVADLAVWLGVNVDGDEYAVYCSPDVPPGLLLAILHTVGMAR